MYVDAGPSLEFSLYTIVLQFSFTQVLIILDLFQHEHTVWCIKVRVEELRYRAQNPVLNSIEHLKNELEH